jgi:DNA repair protein RadC
MRRLYEQMRILILDTKNQVVENISRYQGTVNSPVLRAAEIYRPAILRNRPAVLICHNHPSGDPTPSPEDIAVTEQLVAAGQHLDIELVIGNQRFVSLKERLRW